MSGLFTKYKWYSAKAYDACENLWMFSSVFLIMTFQEIAVNRIKYKLCSYVVWLNFSFNTTDILLGMCPCSFECTWKW